MLKFKQKKILHKYSGKRVHVKFYLIRKQTHKLKYYLRPKISVILKIFTQIKKAYKKTDLSLFKFIY